MSAGHDRQAREQERDVRGRSFASCEDRTMTPAIVKPIATGIWNR
jgi:hypothetical protein